MVSIVDHMEAPLAEFEHAVMLNLRDDLFLDEALSSIEQRALGYVQAGVPVHFRGPAGTGKTTLAMRIAARLGRPAILMTGDGWMTASDLVGKEVGVKQKHVVDNFVHNVRKTASETSAIWADDRLTNAIEGGFTLVYDEFTRSPPKANNPLLMALEERMVILPQRARAKVYMRAHPEFRAIFTSNPEDYAGVSAPQDALLDRMITFDLSGHERSTEIGIVANRSGLDPDQCGMIVDIIRKVRDDSKTDLMPSLRAGIMIARIVKAQSIPVTHANAQFVQLCVDVLQSRSTTRAEQDGRRKVIMGHLRSVSGQTRPTAA